MIGDHKRFSFTGVTRLFRAHKGLRFPMAHVLCGVSME